MYFVTKHTQEESRTKTGSGCAWGWVTIDGTPTHTNQLIEGEFLTKNDIKIFYIIIDYDYYHYNILLSEGKQFSTILTPSLINTVCRCANIVRAGGNSAAEEKV